jgi:hypothetical protein
MNDEAREPFDFNPNSTNGKGEDYYDPWTAMRIHCGGYGSEVDLDVIRVLRAIAVGSRNCIEGLEGPKGYVTDIAEQTGMSASHVELIQYMLCSADWCDYGTSPRGCFPNWDGDFEALIAAWEKYYEQQWGEPVPLA